MCIPQVPNHDCQPFRNPKASKIPRVIGRCAFFRLSALCSTNIQLNACIWTDATIQTAANIQVRTIATATAAIVAPTTGIVGATATATGTPSTAFGEAKLSFAKERGTICKRVRTHCWGCSWLLAHAATTTTAANTAASVMQPLALLFKVCFPFPNKPSVRLVRCLSALQPPAPALILGGPAPPFPGHPDNDTADPIFVEPMPAASISTTVILVRRVHRVRVLSGEHLRDLVPQL
jgi:hypothetical protein